MAPYYNQQLGQHNHPRSKLQCDSFHSLSPSLICCVYVDIYPGWLLSNSAQSRSDHLLLSHLKQGGMNKPFLSDFCVSSTLGTSGVSSGHLSSLQVVLIPPSTKKFIDTLCEVIEMKYRKKIVWGRLSAKIMLFYSWMNSLNMCDLLQSYFR